MKSKGSLPWISNVSSAPKTPDVHIDCQMNELMMMASDITVKKDPEYRKICEIFLFDNNFIKAWEKFMMLDRFDV